jgi:hypothetical protein
MFYMRLASFSPHFIVCAAIGALALGPLPSAASDTNDHEGQAVERFIDAATKSSPPTSTSQAEKDDAKRQASLGQLRFDARGFIDGYVCSLRTRPQKTLLNTARLLQRNKKALTEEYAIHKNKVAANIESRGLSSSAQKQLMQSYKNGFAEGMSTAKSAPSLDWAVLRRELNFQLVSAGQSLTLSAADIETVFSEAQRWLYQGPEDTRGY